MRHKDDSTQENKGHGYNLDHRTTRFCAPGPGNEHFGSEFGIDAVIVNIALMDIVPMDSARWQGPDVPVLGEGTVFDASLRPSLAEWD